MDSSTCHIHGRRKSGRQGRPSWAQMDHNETMIALAERKELTIASASRVDENALLWLDVSALAIQDALGSQAARDRIC